MRTLSSVALAATTLLLLDTLLCMEKEVRYVWRSPNSRKLSRVLYVYNRYMPLLWNTLELAFMRSVSDMSCTVLGWLTVVLSVLSLLGPATFTTLRIYALSGRNNVVSGVGFLLGFTPFFINAGSLYLSGVVNLPPPQNCTGYLAESTRLHLRLVITSRTCLILADILAVLVTWRRTHMTPQLRTSTQLFQRPSLEQVLWANGNVYFCTLAGLNVVDIILVVLSATTSAESRGRIYVAPYIDPSILISRFLLALYETNASLERGGTSVSSISFDHGVLGADTAESPELPEFLHSIAGPILPDIEDEDGRCEFDLGLIREAETEVEAVPGLEVQDGDT